MSKQKPKTKKFTSQVIDRVKIIFTGKNYQLHLPIGMGGDSFLRWRNNNLKKLSSIGVKFN